MASKNAPAAHQKHLAVLIDADKFTSLLVMELLINLHQRDSS